MDFRLPPLGEGADSGTVVNIFVKPGDVVAKGQAVLELENEKAIAAIPVTEAGTVNEIFVKAGDKVSVGQRILSLAGAGPKAAPPAPEGARESAAASAPTSAKAVPPPRPAETLVAAGPEEEFVSRTEPVAAPTLRRLADDLGIDLRQVRGTGRGDRVVMADLREYVQGLIRRATQAPTALPAPAVPAASTPAPEPIDFSQWGEISRQPLSQLRQVIARRMAESWSAVARVTQFDEADITVLNDLRKKHSPAYEQKGARLTLTPMVLKAVVTVLKNHPTLNSSLDETRQELVLKHYYHLGVAVDTEAGLLVPVVRDVDRKSVLQLALEVEGLAKKARERKVTKEELRGGTFTVSNQGGIGGGPFTPIVNRPEVAILGLGRGALKPVVRGNQIEPRLLLPLALSYDHRVIDGGTAARFIVDLVKALQEFDEEAMEL